ncbi:hypothetical protein LDL59_07065 [Kaistella anthropi]|nr:hypothetical protein [Kaistella anthropi]
MNLKKKKLNSYGITVVMGTWCEDSYREVPRLMKILESMNFPEQKLKIIAVNRKKKLQTAKKAFTISKEFQPSSFKNMAKKLEGLLNIQQPVIWKETFWKSLKKIILHLKTY